MIIDVNVSLSRWPFRRLRGDETPVLVDMLRQRGVSQAWAGSFDGLLHKDVAGVNARLAADCRRWGGGFLLPLGTINPKLPDWEEDLRRCEHEHGMQGIRLYPNYHGYTLDDLDFARLLRLAQERNFIVQLVQAMEDERTQHPLVRVAPVDLSRLPAVLTSELTPRLMILNGVQLRSQEWISMLAAKGVSFDIPMLEGVAGVMRLIKQAGIQHVLFGSHFPFFTWESARLKVQESGLDETMDRAVLGENARRLIEGR